MSEIRLQAACYQWTHNNYPQTRGLIFAVPNGGTRHKIEAMQLKASGLVAGIPDVLLVWKAKIYPFEFKTRSGRLKANQQKIHEIWNNQGVPVTVIRSFEQWEKTIKSIIL